MNEHNDDDGNIYADSVPEQSHSSKKGKKTNWVLWIFLGLGGSFLALVLCCGGLGYFGLSAATDLIKQSYENHPIVVEHIGTVEEFSINFADSEKAKEASPANKGAVFDISGDKGSGQIWLEQTADNQFKNAELHINGQVFELGPPNPPQQ